MRSHRHINRINRRRKISHKRKGTRRHKRKGTHRHKRKGTRHHRHKHRKNRTKRDEAGAGLGGGNSIFLVIEEIRYKPRLALAIGFTKKNSLRGLNSLRLRSLARDKFTFGVGYLYQVPYIGGWSTKPGTVKLTGRKWILDPPESPPALGTIRECCLDLFINEHEKVDPSSATVRDLWRTILFGGPPGMEEPITYWETEDDGPRLFKLENAVVRFRELYNPAPGAQDIPPTEGILNRIEEVVRWRQADPELMRAHAVRREEWESRRREEEEKEAHARRMWEEFGDNWPERMHDIVAVEQTRPDGKYPIFITRAGDRQHTSPGPFAIPSWERELPPVTPAAEAPVLPSSPRDGDPIATAVAATAVAAVNPIAAVSSGSSPDTSSSSDEDD